MKRLTNSLKANSVLTLLACLQTTESLADVKADTFLAFSTFHAMTKKLEQKRAEGRRGWWDEDSCTDDHLLMLLKEHLELGDWLDVTNFAAMLFCRHEARAIKKILQHRRRGLR